MDVLMPQLGETVAEGKITKWFKSAGDQVKPGDNLFEIETDKVSMEVPSTTSGVLSEIFVAAGDVAPVGAVVAVIANGAGAAPSQPAEKPAARAAVNSLIPATAGNQTSASPAPHGRGMEQIKIPLDPFFEVRTPARNYGPARLSGGIAVTPLARRLAGEAGIALSNIRGSGPHGRIVARDIETAAPIAGPASAALAAAPDAAAIKALYAPGSYQEVPLDSMRRTIAARLTQAIQTIPHFHLTADIAIDRLKSVREEANASALPVPNPSPQAGKGGAGTAFKLSLNDFIIRALALALRQLPAANAVWAGDRILRFTHSDLGIAVALDGGLITPVLRSADTKSVSTISAEVKDLVARAREKKLSPADYQGGASTISNLGMYAVREFSAIINPPHATILAVGAARRQAIETASGGVTFASMLTMTLSCDHRVIDGAVGAQLVAAIKAYLENPVSMLV
jgi:pyruvate dehydrogenase E2 component (dihydrolipoamide acetyltransferase)